MEEEIKVSLIIPVYNVEKYLYRCLFTAVNQTLEDIEIIVINDGSTDNSLEIIKLFALCDRRIKIVDQANHGLSYARNIGISMARGKYIAFMDSDDFASTNFLEKMYVKAEKEEAQIVICNYKRVRESSKKIYMSPRKRIGAATALTSEEALKALLMDLKINNYVWDKLYRRELFADHEIRFPVGASYEDLATTYKLFFYAKKIVCINDCLYYYLNRSTSITKSFQIKHADDIVQALSGMQEFLRQNGVFDSYEKEYRFLCSKNKNFLIAKNVKQNKKNKQKSALASVREISDRFHCLLEPQSEDDGKAIEDE